MPDEADPTNPADPVVEGETPKEDAPKADEPKAEVEPKVEESVLPKLTDEQVNELAKSDPRFVDAVSASEQGNAALTQTLDRLLADKEVVRQADETAKAALLTQEEALAANRDGNPQPLADLKAKELEEQLSRASAEPGVREEILDDYDAAVSELFADDLKAITPAAAQKLERRNFPATKAGDVAFFKAVTGHLMELRVARIASGASDEVDEARTAAKTAVDGVKARSDVGNILPGAIPLDTKDQIAGSTDIRALIHAGIDDDFKHEDD